MRDPIPSTMRAVVYRGANDLRLELVPVPRIGPNELLVRVALCGVCPTDIKKIVHGTVTPPRIFGHETAGTIVRIGSRVRGFHLGDRVALHHHVPCLACHACRHGAFAQCSQYKRTGITAGFEPAGGGYAEYVRVMSFVLPGVVKIPPRNTFLEGALLEPVNTVLKAVRRLRLLPKDRVWIIGQGPIGLLFTRLLELQNVEVVASDLLPERLRRARRWGARWGFHAAQTDFMPRLTRLTRRKPLDAVIVTVPRSDVIEPAQSLLRGGGQILLFAHTQRDDRATLDLSSLCMDEKDLIGSYSSDFRIQAEVARLVFSRRLDVRSLVTHVFPLEQTADAVLQAARPQAQSLKIVIAPDIMVPSPTQQPRTGPGK